MPLSSNKAFLQPPQNIPVELYDKIEQCGGHYHEGRMFDIFDDFLKPTNQCTLEQLHLIFTQTGHLALNEFKPVPQSIRQLLNQLWLYIQHPATNLSATQTTQTCIGTIHDQLKPLVNAHHETLYNIRLLASDKQQQYQDSQYAVVKANRALQQSLDDNRYSGIDLRAPSPAMLKALSMKLSIKNSDDFKWFCSFPPDVMMNFLNQPDNEDGPKQYIVREYSQFNLIAELFLSLPIHAYAPILSVFVLTEKQWVPLIIFLDNDHKKDALFHIFKNKLVYMIEDCSTLTFVLGNSNDNQCSLVLTALRNKLSVIIGKDYSKLIDVLRFLNDNNKDLVLTALHNKLRYIIYQNFMLQRVFCVLNDNQRDLVLTAFNDDFIYEIICCTDFIFIEGFFRDYRRANYQLSSLLADLNDNQRKKILLSIRGDLPHIIKNEPSLSDNIYIQDALSHSHHSFFYPYRARIINNGSLSSKLNKYIHSRKSEAGFHWDFLGVMAFFYWLSGSTWVKAKNTKLAAATYALHAYEGNDDCLVRLTKLDAMPADYRLYKNRYLLIDSKQLYYVDYDGHPIKISIKNNAYLQTVFDTNADCQLTYAQVHNILSPLIKSPLPTDVQLNALKEGLLGDIVIDAGVDYILAGETELFTPNSPTFSV